MGHKLKRKGQPLDPEPKAPKVEEETSQPTDTSVDAIHPSDPAPDYENADHADTDEGDPQHNDAPDADDPTTHDSITTNA